MQEYLAVADVDEAIVALEALPTKYRYLLVDKLVNTRLDGGNKIVVLAERLIATARKRLVISPEDFDHSLLPTAEFVDNICIDVPKAYEWLARLIVAAGLDKSKAGELAGNSQNSPSRSTTERVRESIVGLDECGS